MSEGNGWVDAGDVSAVAPGEMAGIEIGGARIVLANVEGTFYALENQCSHADYPLSEGELEGTTVECIFHGAKFDVCTGRALQLPAIRPVKSYDVEVRDDRVFIRLT
jgi:nitrite reductase/ring-hydroxylating ferredoxin subunit